ncbi:MAG TPA: rhodanese-like domain-containing protein [Polyangiaceae bacterium]|nr:rhodanese-like domain-containing protein [Polyangiaceae bacterium]
MTPTRISPQEASDKLAQGWTYVDVRTVEEFEAGHPPGAVNVPIAHSGPGGMVQNGDFLRVMNAAFGKDAKIVVGCKSGGRSLRAAQMLLADGFVHVVDQRAGWDGARGPFGDVSEPGWSRAGLPAEAGQPSGRAWEDMKKKAG